MRPISKVTNPYISADEYKGHEAITIHFEVIQGNLLRSTKEYSLTYVPKIDEWLGDAIAYGQWSDLELEEVGQLRDEYGLDMLMKDVVKILVLY